MSVVAAPEQGVEGETIVARVFTLLSAFRTTPVVGVSELARLTGLPRTTVHRLANQLLDVGALSRVGSKYRLGATLFELGNLHFPARMRETLQPYLDDLQRVTGGDVALFELVGDHVIALQVARARKSASTLVKLGARIPSSLCSGGRVLVAHQAPRPNKEQRAILAAGYLLDKGIDEPNRTSVAAPVVNRRNRVLASLMVSVPTGSHAGELSGIVTATTSFARTLTYAGKTADVDFLAHALPRPHHARPIKGRTSNG